MDMKTNCTLTVADTLKTIKIVDSLIRQLRKPTKANKGKRGQSIEHVLGIPNGNSLLDLKDGELKSYTRGQTICITQLKHCLGEIIDNPVAFCESKVGIKMKNAIFVSFYKSGQYNEHTHVNKHTHPVHYAHVEEDYNFICDEIRQRQRTNTMLSTITGPNGVLQVRTKASKIKKGGYRELSHNGWIAKDKNMAFYLMGRFGIELFQRCV